MEYAIARLAVHTNERVLHPAAMLDYRARLRELVAAGCLSTKQPCSGARLPRSSMFHSPPADVLDILPPGVPPIRVVPLRGPRMSSVAGRIGEDTNFRSLCIFSRRSVVVAPGTSPSGRLGALPWPCRDLVRYAGAGAGKRTLANRPACQTMPIAWSSTSGVAAAARSGRYARAVVEALALRAPGTASVEGTRVRAGAFPRSWTSLRGITGSSGAYVFAAGCP